MGPDPDPLAGGVEQRDLLRIRRAQQWTVPHTLSTSLVPKLTPPTPRGHQIAREVLLNRLDQAGMERLVLVCAPAGFGKTTTLEQWRIRLADQGVATAWLVVNS